MTKRLHDEIYAELPEDFIRRMRNWVRGRDGSVVATSSFRDFVDTSGYREAPMPVLLGEAQDTEAAIRKLPQRYSEVVSCFWLYEHREVKWMATATPRLRLWKLGPASFTEWLSIGHERLRVLVAKRSEQHNGRTEVAQ